MLAQIRIYTINRGEMDAFIEHFQRDVLPLHTQIGCPVVGVYVNRPQNEVVWIRTYSDEADREAKQKAFQEARAAANVTLGLNVAKMEVRDVEVIGDSVPVA
jgi:hypothetical protein